MRSAILLESAVKDEFVDLYGGELHPQGLTDSPTMESKWGHWRACVDSILSLSRPLGRADRPARRAQHLRRRRRACASSTFSPLLDLVTALTSTRHATTVVLVRRRRRRRDRQPAPRQRDPVRQPRPRAGQRRPEECVLPSLPLASLVVSLTCARLQSSTWPAPTRSPSARPPLLLSSPLFALD